MSEISKSQLNAVKALHEWRTQSDLSIRTLIDEINKSGKSKKNIYQADVVDAEHGNAFKLRKVIDAVVKVYPESGQLLGDMLSELNEERVSYKYASTPQATSAAELAQLQAQVIDLQRQLLESKQQIVELLLENKRLREGGRKK
jgi:hypothetical protein